MTIEELYQQIGGDYDNAVARLFSPDFVGKFIVKFADDPSCAEIVEAWNAGDEKAAFEAAHKAKGVCGNLSLTQLESLSSQICEALRPGNDDLRASTDVASLVAELSAAHAAALSAIRAFAAQ